ncbi:SLD7 [Candida jiufengensis]|uniref:SLD7 n=1 Tax=Candida jiufengensis TaxID=497108 RepID=UPI0022257607|nr:SLD7 [Candida jiufengensis]KAI5951538.1 SLD7 [Candida jiufengensis]
MNHKFTTSIYDFGKTINDVQFWSKQSNYNSDEYIDNLSNCLSSSSCEYFTYINYTKLPIYLINGHSFQIFTNDEDTESYFKQKVIVTPDSNKEQDYGILAKIKNNSNKYLIFYFNKGDQTINCLILDLDTITKVQKLILDNDFDDNTFITTKKSTRNTPDTNIFDKVLKQKQKNNPFLRTTSSFNSPNSNNLSLSILSTQDQINNAINKLILSGLRIRGLSTNQAKSVNEKLKIKEIHQMTYKAAIFSLRKYNNNLLDGTNKRLELEKPQIKFNDVQETIETLLHLFVDVE